MHGLRPSQTGDFCRRRDDGSVRIGGGAKFEKETDIFDVWLGIRGRAYFKALIADEPTCDPLAASDLYLEGVEINIAGGFQSSLLCAMGTHGNAAV